MEIKIRVCNACQDRSLETSRYTITSEDGRKIAVDLCEGHSQPLEAYLRQSPTPAPKGRQKGSQGASGRSSGGSRRRVTTMDEIEAMKGK